MAHEGRQRPGPKSSNALKSADTEMKEGWRENVPMLYEYLLDHHIAPCGLREVCWELNEAQLPEKHRLFYGSPRSRSSTRCHIRIGLPTIPTTEAEKWDNVSSHFLNITPDKHCINLISTVDSEDKIHTFTAMPRGGLVALTGNRISLYPSIEDTHSTKPVVFSPSGSRLGINLYAQSRSIVNGTKDGQFLLYDPSRPEFPVEKSDSYMDELVSILAVDGHPSDNWFCGATSGGQLLIWDRRQRQVYKSKSEDRCSMLSCSWNSMQPFHILTSSTTGHIMLWDLRTFQNTSRASWVKVFDYHVEPVNCVRWSPHSTNIFAAASNDMSIIIANADKDPIGSTMDNTALIFRHFLHHSPVKSLSWHPQLPMTLASISEGRGRRNTVIQIWKPNMWFARNMIR